MNPYRAMLEELPVPEGQAERLRAAVVAGRPKRRRAFRPWGLGKRAVLAALIAAGVLASAAVAAGSVDWDPAFSKAFNLESRNVPGAEGVFQDVNAVSVCGDVTLTVRQAIGDKKNLYLLLDYQLPESADLDAVMEGEHLPPLYILVYKGRQIAWEDVRELSGQEELWRAFGPGDVSGLSTCSLAFDPETRTLTNLVECNFGEWSLLAKMMNATVTLLVEPPEVKIGEEAVPLADHAAVVSFKPSFDVDTAKGSVKEDGVSYKAEVSPLSVQVRMKGNDMPDTSNNAVSRELQESMVLRFRDGTERSALELEPSGGNSSSSASFTHHDGGRLSGTIVMNIVFETFVDPSEVEAVLMGDVEIPVS